MLASLLSPTSSAPTRISQLLPSVKCSTCHQPVPLAELGEHTCEAPPPVPSLPKPTITPEAATALLPGHLQGRIASSSSPPRAQEHQRIPSSASARLRINTKGGGSPTQATFQPKSSPLARSDSSDVKVTPARDPPFPSSSPLRTRPPASDVRMRTPSISNQSTPATARPSISFTNQDSTPTATAPPPRNGNASPFPTSPSRGPPPALGQGVPQQRTGLPPNPNNRPAPGSGPYNPPPPQTAPAGAFPNRPGPPSGAALPHHHPGGPPNIPPNQAFVPPAERGIDTKSGGAAGMAGVGRRGFAAAARAAMFVGPQGPQPLYGRRMNGNPGPRYLDIDAASRSTETPPLSAGSGYSSHSPGPTSPLPQSDFSLQPNPGLAVKPPLPRTPSPGRQFLVTPTPTISTTQSENTASNRPPFFVDNARGRMGDLPNPLITNPTLPPPPPPPQTILPRNPSTASSKSAYSRTSRKTAPNVGSPTSPIESESEYGGLAYADSTDYEDDGPNVNTTKTSNEEKRAYDVRESIAQALNDAATKKGSRHIQFGSVSLRSRSRSSDIGDRKSAASNGSAKAMAVAISRADSVSSYSSTSSAGGDSAIRARARADSSSTVARALGLCQTPPSEYAKLGGPGVKGVGGRMRSASGTSSASNGSRSVHSMSNSNPMERGMETLMEDDANGKTTAMTTMPMTSAAVSGTQRSLFGSVSSTRSALRRADTAGSSTSSRDERSRRLQDDADESVIGGVSGGGSKAHRSNTVPGHQPQQLQSPDGGKPVKLPTRSLTSPQLERHAPALPLGGGVRDGGGGGTPTKGKGVLKKERAAKKVRACLRCAKTIEDGRWVSVDGGGVLCERCWKNMYLPKCRRCNLPIERAAVSSSDGQLKGKYHKECFNCHTCQKPFPDKTFYVYDGKPLCAYHYHEANDSLCAAARCGQPIEGPCAVSHTGDRYHPEHMTCEFPGYPACRERLEVEYWEVDGRMLCAGHANRGEGSVGGSESEDELGEERWVRGAKAMKRITRFIDLAGAGGGAVGAGAGVGVEGSELR